MDYKLIIYKANSLTRASFRLTLNEQRLILACISQIQDPRKPLSNKDEFSISALHFSRLFDIPLNHAYGELSEAIDGLLTKPVVIERPDESDPRLSRIKTGWASSAKYYDGEGRVVVRFRDEIIPYLSDLKDGCFTKYRIARVAKVKSVYAIRIYELLVSESWKNTDLEIKISDLKQMFDFSQDEYSRVYDFKKFVIDPSVDSINKHTDCSVSYETKKTGREVTHIVFKYSINKPKALPKIKRDKETPIKEKLTQDESLEIVKRLDEMAEQKRKGKIK